MSRELSPAFDRKLFRSMEEFEALVGEIVGESTHWLYRGQGVLVAPAPRYFRERRSLPKSNADELEESHIEKFRKKLGGRFPTDARSDWWVLTWLQHYGAPTRLLDWTCDPMIALWFAARARLDGIESGVANQSSFATVWLIKTKKEQWAHLAELEHRPCGVKDVLFAQPPEIDVRVLIQRSVFSVHRMPRSSVDSCWDDLVGMLHHGSLVSLAADDSILPGILNSLDRKGISAKSIYPDLADAARDVNSNYLDAPALKLLQSSIGISWSKS